MTPCPFSHFYIMYNHIPIDPYRFLGPLWSIVPLSHRFSVLRRRCWGVSTISVHRTSKRRTNDANDKMKWHRSRLLWMRHQKKIYEHLKRACARRNAYTCLVDIVSCSGIFGEYWPISFLWFTFSIFKMVEKQPNQQRYRWYDIWTMLKFHHSWSPRNQQIQLHFQFFAHTGKWDAFRFSSALYLQINRHGKQFICHDIVWII